MTESGRPMARRAGRIFRHFVFMMIGALLAVPYIATFIWATQLAAVDAGLAAFAFALLFALLAVPAALPVTRELERTAVRELLSVELPDLPAESGSGRRWRGAAWYLIHLLAGSLLLFTLVVAGPMILAVAFRWLAGQSQSVAELAAVVVPFVDTTTAVLWTLGLSLTVVVFTVLTGSALPHWADRMLGPSPAELAALDEERARDEARRNELARELHDSVGHALTVTTLQATAAQGLLARNPDAAARAMQAVADTGRTALTELDHVIGLLRSSAPAGAAAGLEELPRSLERFAMQGLAVEHDYDDEGLARLPRDVSVTAHRILQEGLTNALKYAQPKQARPQLRSDASSLRIRLSNPISNTADTPAPAPASHGITRSTSAGGRGLDGIRERARLTGGSANTVVAAGQWILEVELPVTDGAPGLPGPHASQRPLHLRHSLTSRRPRKTDPRHE
ncbi:histidine kinase [Arthrobacter crystallopoietes BAB-32]|uniref:histidine kinase n=1 Tax=Arthrobacter crystallopoietes BAB-32 TaxID=1246476 RepID=N1UXN3_9MICC|nr:histidine kinase [Arthrobacter crystallopoietes]EMY32539.1 histidine kinase [Arthrobacter crystallopoietes BAB-32]